MWEFQARIDDVEDDVVDGDTIDLVFDLGFRTYKTARIRLKNVDTAEIYGYSKDSDEYQQGIEHKEFVEAWLKAAEADHDGKWSLKVFTDEESGKYGRWIAKIRRKSDDSMLSDALKAEFPELDE